MKLTARKWFALLLCLILSLNTGISAIAANENNTQEVAFSAALSPAQLETSDADQSVTLTISASKAVTMDGCGFTAVWDEALKLSAVSENLDNFSYPADSVDLETGIVGGCSDDMENVTGATELAVLTFTVPAGTPAGTYEIGAKDLELTKDYGEVIWESAASVSAVLTIADPADPDAPADPADSVRYLIVLDGHALTGSTASEGFSISHTNYFGMKGTAYDENTDITDDMLWTVSMDNGKYTISQNGKYLNAVYQQVEGINYLSALKLDETQDTWTLNADGLLQSANTERFLAYSGASGSANKIFTTRSQSTAVTLIPYELTGISITTAPYKTVYFEEQDFDTTAMVVTAAYSNGSSKVITDYTVVNGENLALNQESVTISYTEAGVTKTAEQAITVKAKSFAALEITQAPAKTEYIEGQNFDPAGMIVTATYSNGKTAEITDYTIVNGENLALDQEDVTISYKVDNITITATQAITVAAKALTKIEITTVPTKTEYIEGLDFDPTGMVVTATYSNGKTAEVTGYTAANGENLTLGQESVTISYTEAGVTETAEQAITVIEKTLTRIEITTAPTKTEYIETLDFDPAGMVVSAVYSNGTKKEVTDYTITGGEALTVGQSEVTISYTEGETTVTAAQAITVVGKALTKIEITTAPAKTEYIEGQDFDPAGMVVTATYSNGATKEITDYTVANGENLTLNQESVTISCTEGEITVNALQAITVIEKVLTKIEITRAPDKIQYAEGEDFDPAGMVVTATYSNDATAEVTDYTIADSEDLLYGQSEVTVSYTEGEITATAVQAITVLPHLTGTTMTLGNNLSINFVVDTAKLSGTGHYAVITKEYEDKDDLTITIPRSEWKVYSGTNYYFSFDKVAAKEMTDRLIVNVYDADGNKVVNEKIDSVRDYAMRALTKEEAKTAPDAEKLALYVDMLNYGAAAQTYFDNYHASDLANSQLTDAQKAYATASVTMKDSREKGTSYVGTTLTLESEIILNFVYNKNEIRTISYAVATYTDHYGNEKSVTIQSSEFKEYDATRTYIPVSGMAVADCSQPVTLKLYTAFAGSMGVDSSTTVDSVESYVARIANADALYTTIMKFAASAYASFH